MGVGMVLSKRGVWIHWNGFPHWWFQINLALNGTKKQLTVAGCFTCRSQIDFMSDWAFLGPNELETRPYVLFVESLATWRTLGRAVINMQQWRKTRGFESLAWSTDWLDQPVSAPLCVLSPCWHAFPFSPIILWLCYPLFLEYSWTEISIIYCLNCALNWQACLV